LFLLNGAVRSNVINAAVFHTYKQGRSDKATLTNDLSKHWPCGSETERQEFDGFEQHRTIKE